MFFKQLTVFYFSTHVHTWLRCGECCDELGSWQEAVKMFEFVLSLDPNNAVAKLKLFALQQEHMLNNEKEFSVNIHDDSSNVKVSAEVSKLCILLNSRTTQ